MIVINRVTLVRVADYHFLALMSTLVCLEYQSTVGHINGILPNIHDRISQLEGLVVSLASTVNATKHGGKSCKSYESAEQTFTSGAEYKAEATDSEIDQHGQMLDTFGRINLENAETSYVGSAYWMAILDGVSRLQYSPSIV